MFTTNDTSVATQLTDPQWEFFNLDCDFPAFVGGFGSGKTQTLTIRTIADLLEFPGLNVANYAPSYDLIRMNMLPRYADIFTAMGLKFTLNKSQFTIYVDGFGQIIFRSLANPDRIVGYEVFRSHIDEIDVLPRSTAEMAWNKIIARNRQTHRLHPNARNRVGAYSTPEGFRFMYHMWHKSPPSDQYQIVRAPTYSNPFLPQDYVDNLRATYPEGLIDAYLEGRFVNLTGSQVYSSFERFSNDTGETVRGNEPILVGQDFNVGKMASTVAVRRKDGIHAVDEIYGLLDTPHVIQALQEKYPNNPITVYPDASGKNRATANATTSDLKLLRKAGFRVKVDGSNPRIRDRTLAMNAAFGTQGQPAKLFVNTDRCPNLTDCLEQQTWTDAGIPDKQNDYDHLPDGLGYMVHKEMPVRRPATKGGAHIATLG